MNPRVLFLITGDPRKSPRPAEALRIAAGVAVWEKTDITIYLHKNAVQALSETADDLMEKDDYANYWKILAESNRSIYVEKNAGALPEPGTSAIAFTEISGSELAELAAEQTYVIRF